MTVSESGTTNWSTTRLYDRRKSRPEDAATLKQSFYALHSSLGANYNGVLRSHFKSPDNRVSSWWGGRLARVGTRILKPAGKLPAPP